MKSWVGLQSSECGMCIRLSPSFSIPFFLSPPSLLASYWPSCFICPSFLSKFLTPLHFSPACIIPLSYLALRGLHSFFIPTFPSSVIPSFLVPPSFSSFAFLTLSYWFHPALLLSLLSLLPSYQHCHPSFLHGPQLLSLFLIPLLLFLLSVLSAFSSLFYKNQHCACEGGA